MAKNKKKTTTVITVKQKARRRRGPRRQRRGKGRMGISNALAEKVCSNFDPFCDAALGAKLFDTNTTPSLTYTSRNLIAMTTDAAGMALTWVSASPQNSINIATIAAGNVSAWANNGNAFYNSVGGSVNQWRVVSFGVRDMTTQAWTAATGYKIYSATLQKFNGSTGWTANTNTLGAEVRTTPLRDAKMTWIGQPRGMESLTYQQGMTADDGFNELIIFAFGAVSTTIGYIEVIIHYEWQPLASSAYHQFASAAAPHVPLIMDARTTLSSTTNSIKALTDGAAAAKSYMMEAKGAIASVAGVGASMAELAGIVDPRARGAAIGLRGVEAMLM